jgi:hypothetical protein
LDAQIPQHINALMEAVGYYIMARMQLASLFPEMGNLLAGAAPFSLKRQCCARGSGAGHIFTAARALKFNSSQIYYDGREAGDRKAAVFV